MTNWKSTLLLLLFVKREREDCATKSCRQTAWCSFHLLFYFSSWVLLPRLSKTQCLTGATSSVQYHKLTGLRAAWNIFIYSAEVPPESTSVCAFAFVGLWRFSFPHMRTTVCVNCVRLASVLALSRTLLGDGRSMCVKAEVGGVGLLIINANTTQ